MNGKGSCWVLEFKPAGWNGKDKLPDYVRAVRGYYEAHMRANEDASSELGGHEFQTLVETNCRAGRDTDKAKDDLNFQTKQVEYERCSRRYECEQ